jgi:transcriptional regulator with XRE-family HTH domain
VKRSPHPFVLTLAAERQRLGLSLKEMSRRTGISRTAFSNWEKGVWHPSVDGLREYAVALGFHLLLVRSKPAVRPVADCEQRRAS